MLKETNGEKKKIYFSDFNGVHCTKADEFCSFESFMKAQYERNKEERNYTDYETIKYDNSEKCYVFCLTDTWQSKALWEAECFSHNYEGFCIGYKATLFELDHYGLSALYAKIAVSKIKLTALIFFITVLL